MYIIKKGDIWISAVIYMGIGIVILVLVLSVGIPTINRIRDKNIATETQELMLALDKNIREVYSEGPGSKRTIKLDVKRGDLAFDQVQELITWNFETGVLLTEPNITIKRGTLEILTTQTSQKRKYITNFKINYNTILDLELKNPQAQFAGATTIIITNIGAKAPSNLPTILVETI